MEIDKNVLNQALSADPRRIESLAKEIAKMLGLPEEKALAVAQNSDLIKAKLKTMSQRDLQNAAAVLGEENAARIMDLLKGSGHG
ncbi:MAG: hypothetical protein HFE77_00710 [Clostridiales bacterium]|nr:hypothetical protein [Clostridiales bacterium]